MSVYELISEHGVSALNPLSCLKAFAVGSVKKLQYADTHIQLERLLLSQFSDGCFWPIVRVQHIYRKADG